MNVIIAILKPIYNLGLQLWSEYSIFEKPLMIQQDYGH